MKLAISLTKKTISMEEALKIVEESIVDGLRIGYADNPDQAQEYGEEALALLRGDVPVERD